ncbi:hypothetical protein HAX54_042068, partial [Datura stramonium]|nr:hypothetical protein [Datura stramonium]
GVGSILPILEVRQLDLLSGSNAVAKDAANDQPLSERIHKKTSVGETNHLEYLVPRGEQEEMRKIPTMSILNEVACATARRQVLPCARNEHMISKLSKVRYKEGIQTEALKVSTQRASEAAKEIYTQRSVVERKTERPKI